MTLIDADAYLVHQECVSDELLKHVLSNRRVTLVPWEDDGVDLIAHDPFEYIDVKRAREDADRRSLSISQRQFEKHASEYDALVYAIWSDVGRLALSTEQLLDRAVKYRGGDVHEGRNGRTPYYLFDVSDDAFVNPFQRERRLRGPNVPHDAQLGLDGRATSIVSNAPLGERQRMILEALRRSPLKAYEIGTFLHAARGHCNDAPSRRQLARSLRTSECCVGAVDDGGAMVTSLRDRGMIWKDDAGFWHLYPEDVEGWAA